MLLLKIQEAKIFSRKISIMLFVFCITFCDKPKSINQTNKNGCKIGEWFYLNSKKDTIKKDFYNSDCELLLEQIYISNTKSIETFYEEGLKKKKNQFYADGSLRAKIIFFQGKDNYREETFYKNGNLRTVSTHSNGKMEGMFEQYHKNGNIFFKANNVKEGKGYVYDSFGKIERVVLLKNYLEIDTLEEFKSNVSDRDISKN